MLGRRIRGTKGATMSSTAMWRSASPGSALRSGRRRNDLSSRRCRMSRPALLADCRRGDGAHDSRPRGHPAVLAKDGKGNQHWVATWSTAMHEPDAGFGIANPGSTLTRPCATQVTRHGCCPSMTVGTTCTRTTPAIRRWPKLSISSCSSAATKTTTDRLGNTVRARLTARRFEMTSPRSAWPSTTPFPTSRK